MNKSSVVYGRPTSYCAYIFEFKDEIWLERGKIFTALFGKSYPLWKENEEWLKFFDGSADEIFLHNGNQYYWHTNFDDQGTVMTFHTWCHYDYRTYFHVNTVWKLRKWQLVKFKDKVLQPIIDAVYNDPTPVLRRVAFRYGGNGLHRKKFYRN